MRHVKDILVYRAQTECNSIPFRKNSFTQEKLFIHFEKNQPREEISHIGNKRVVTI